MTEQKKHPNYEWIVAFAEGKSLQWRHNGGMWVDFGAISATGPWCAPDWRNIEWRIKPETRWYRVALFDVGHTTGPWPSVVWTTEGEERTEDMQGFVRWFTDRVEYTV
jgi:hypothetical protein